MEVLCVESGVRGVRVESRSVSAKTGELGSKALGVKCGKGFG